MDCGRCGNEIQKDDGVFCSCCAGPRSMRSIKSEIFNWMDKPNSFNNSSYMCSINKSELSHIYNYIKELRTKLGESNDR